MKIKVKATQPFWSMEHDLMEARSNLERDCWEAENLFDAILTGANSIRLDGDMVGYLDENGELQLYGDWEAYTEEELEAVKVEFDTLDRDEDGYTIALFTSVKKKAIDEKVWAEIDRRENELGRKLTIEETEEVWKEMEK